MMHVLTSSAAIGLILGSPGLGVASAATLWASRIHRFGHLLLVPLGIAMVGLEYGSVVGWLVLSLLLAFAQEQATKRRATSLWLFSGLLLVVAGTRGSSLAFAVAFLCWIVALPTPWFGWRTARPVATVWALTALLFLLLPRGSSTQRVRNTGFRTDLALGQPAPLLDDPARVFTARFLDGAPDGPVYFRGVALTEFDGRTWTPSATRVDAPALPLEPSHRVVIEARHADTGVLFAPGNALSIDHPSVLMDDVGGFHVPPDDGAVSYTVFTLPPYGLGATTDDQPAPTVEAPNVSDVTRAPLLASLRGSNPRARMTASAEWLQTSFTYTRSPEPGVQSDPLADFLGGHRSGHCEYFASALAVAGRLDGIPTRVVNGFLSGDVQLDGTRIVRNYHAHSWVEYWVDGQWVMVDPTPPVRAPDTPSTARVWIEPLEDWWDRVVTFDSQSQHSLLAPARRRPFWALILPGSAIGLASLFWWIRGRRHQRPSSRKNGVMSALHRALSALERHGTTPPPGVPVSLFADQLDDPDLQESLRRLAWLANDIEFGGHSVQPRLHEAESLLARIETRLDEAISVREAP